MQALLCAFLIVAAEPLALDNGAIRIEVDPELFSLRFVGAPGGINFVDPLHVEDSARAGGGWVDPGGLISDVVPLESRDAMLRRGPAEVLEYTPSHILLLGPESPEYGLQVKKEIRLINREEAIADYTVTVLSSRVEARTLTLRNTVRIPPKATLRTPRKDVVFTSLSGVEAVAPAIVRSMRYWLIPVPPTAPTRETVFAGTTPVLDLENRDGVWERRVRATDTESAFEAGGNLLVLLDDGTRSYGAALQSPKQAVSTASPLVFTERWELDLRRR